MTDNEKDTYGQKILDLTKKITELNYENSEYKTEIMLLQKRHEEVMLIKESQINILLQEVARLQSRMEELTAKLGNNL